MAIHSFSVNSGRALNQVLKSNFKGQRERQGPLKRLFAAYQRRKQELGVLDYDDLLQRWCELLEHVEVGSRIRARFDHQSASRFRPPDGVATSKPGSRSSRASAREKDSSRRAGKG